MTAVDSKIVDMLKFETGENYPKRWSGFSTTLGSVMEKQLNIPKEKWTEAVVGISRREILLLAAKSLDNMYKKSLLAKVETVWSLRRLFSEKFILSVWSIRIDVQVLGRLPWPMSHFPVRQAHCCYTDT